MMNEERIQSSNSFDSVYEYVFPVLMRVAYHITEDMAVAEDLCQEAFIRYYNRGISFPDKEQAKYWLIRVVKNLALNYDKRSRRERRAYDRVLKEPERLQTSAETELIKKEITDTVQKALSKLPQKLKTVLVLKEYGNLSYREIASMLHITESNVKVRVFRARALLEELLGEEEIDYVS